MTDEERKAYLAELVEVGRRYGVTLGHEDSFGGFKIFKHAGTNVAEMEGWLTAASMGKADDLPFDSRRL